MGAGQSTPAAGGPVVPPVDTTIPAEIKAPAANVLSSNIETPGASSALDASVLERIAKAANELKDNDKADDLIKMMNTQEATYQEKIRLQQENARTETEVQRQRYAQVQEEQKRQTLQASAQQQQQKAQYEDKLARERYNAQLEQQHSAGERERQSQMQAVQQQEQERRRTAEYQAELDRQTAKIRAQAEGMAAAQAERENREIRDQQILLRAGEDRVTTLEGIKEAGRTVGAGITSYLNDKEKIASTVGIVTALAAGVYFTRSAATVSAKFMSDKLMRPPLIRDTSRTSFLTSPVQSIKKIFSSKDSGAVMSGIVLRPDLAERMGDFTIATSHTRKHGANFRNVMLYGPPGTGKTLFATRLAHQSGLEYAVLAGGDIAPLGKDAVTELHNVFDWAESSNKGLLLFIDEADAFLRKRGEGGDGQMTEAMRNTLSTFLYRTGTPSSKVMIAMATNEPSSIDSAVIDRMDEAVLFDLPGPNERERLFEQYFNEKIAAPSGSAAAIRVGEDVNVENWAAIAKATEGFSGRMIMKVVTGWQAAAYASVDNTLTQAMMQNTLDVYNKQQETKANWDNVKLL